MSRNSPNPRAALGLTVLVLIALSLAPSKVSRWLDILRGPTMMALVPISGPLQRVSGALRPPQAAEPEEAKTIEQLGAEIDRLVLRRDELLAENYTLKIQNEQLSRMRVATGVRTATVPATRVAGFPSSGTIEVRPGSRDGVRTNAVAISPGSLQVVGLVTDTSALTATVHLLTDTRFKPQYVEGVVSGADLLIESTGQLDRLPRVQLRPSGRGTLIADSVEIGVAERIAEGDIVRVLDDTWPRAAQLLVLGSVEIQDTDDPLFKRVIVTPSPDPRLVRSMLLRMPETTPASTVGEDAG